jgi:nitrite reductase (NADH) large subunit
MIYPETEGVNEVCDNENMYAKLQKDGTYSVMPQMYGGVTTAAELRKIASIMEKYGINEVGLTPEQRIQLKGINKELIQTVCSELNMRLSPAQTHTIRHVNTFFGEQDCQCNNESALQLAIELEKGMENVLTPHKVVLGVSACKHREVEIMTKDICVIEANRGWELYVGGSMNPSLKQGELFCVASDHQEAKQLVCGFVQYYRETANYLEQIGEWTDRVGLIHIREVLFEDSLREQLIDRLEAEMLSHVGKTV